MSNTSAWFLARSHGAEQRAYPYGNTFERRAATDARTKRTCGEIVYNLTTPVGSLASCVGGYAGLFDMSGNVEEWEDACTLSSAGGDQDTCFTRGGGWPAKTAQLANMGEVGLRCCNR